jgi:List-Bact-rpt repeat protein
MKTALLAFTILSLSVAAGCGSSTGGATGGQDGAADGPVLYTLTVQNYLDWCDVSENGTAYAATVPPVMSFAAGTVVNLNATAATGFVWGYWTGTDGDATSAHDKSMATTVTMTSNKTIVACCPFPPPATQTCP